MADEQGGDNADPLKNLKSEFSRKTDNISAQIEAQNQKMEQIMQAMIAQQQALKVNTSSTNTETEIDPIANPKAYRAKVTADAQQAAIDAVSRMSQTQAEVAGRVNEVVNKLAIDYPELNDRTSPLYVRAQEIQNTMPKEERFSPTGIRAAVREAAADLGLLTSSKRAAKENSGEDFTVGSKGGSGAAPKTPKASKLDDKTIWAAELMGIDITDEKKMASLAKRAERKVWNRYK